MAKVCKGLSLERFCGFIVNDPSMSDFIPKFLSVLGHAVNIVQFKVQLKLVQVPSDECNSFLLTTKTA